MLLRIASDARVPQVFKDAADVIKLARELGGDPYWDWELVIVTSEHRRALFNPSGFEAGRIAGKALLWSFKDGRVLCAANVTATNQDRMTLRFNPEDQRMQQHQVLNDDLKNQAYRAAIDALRAVPAT